MGLKQLQRRAIAWSLEDVREIGTPHHPLWTEGLQEPLKGREGVPVRIGLLGCGQLRCELDVHIGILGHAEDDALDRIRRILIRGGAAHVVEDDLDPREPGDDRFDRRQQRGWTVDDEAGSQLLGAALVIVGDLIPERLAQARSFGCETVDLTQDATLAEQIEQIVGEPEVDSAVDCVGFEARGHGSESNVERPATVLNSLMEVTRAGGSIGIPGLYVTGDPGGVDENAKVGNLGIRIGLGWAKSHDFTTGQCPVMRYHRPLMQAILHEKTRPAEAVNVTVISMDEAPDGYKDFDKGAAKKYVIDPHGMVAA